jgi:hypothetical protein
LTSRVPYAQRRDHKPVPKEGPWRWLCEVCGDEVRAVYYDYPNFYWRHMRRWHVAPWA